MKRDLAGTCHIEPGVRMQGTDLTTEQLADLPDGDAGPRTRRVLFIGGPIDRQVLDVPEDFHEVLATYDRDFHELGVTPAADHPHLGDAAQVYHVTRGADGGQWLGLLGPAARVSATVLADPSHRYVSDSIRQALAAGVVPESLRLAYDPARGTYRVTGVSVQR